MTIGATLGGKFRLVRPGVLAHFCPGCGVKHIIDVHALNADGHRLGWDGDRAAPSIAELVQQQTERGPCEYILRAGVLYFTDRCWHPLAGKSRHLEDCP